MFFTKGNEALYGSLVPRSTNYKIKVFDEILSFKQFHEDIFPEQWLCGLYFIPGDTKNWIEIYIFPTGEYSIISKNDFQEHGILEFGKWTYIKGKVLFQKLRNRNNNYLAALFDSLGGHGTLNILVCDDIERELTILASDNYLNAYKNNDSNMKYLLKKFSYRDWPEILKIHKLK